MVKYCGLGNSVPYEEYMQVINEAFGFVNGHEREFRGLLPKLYAEGRAPQNENYVVTEDGRCVAAVGAYNHEINVCGIRLACRGVGNVAVLKDARSKGYMKDCLNMAMSDMVKDGIAISTLGGRRQRYRYFSYDRAGICYDYVIDSDNIRHTYGHDYCPSVTVHQVTVEETHLIHDISVMSASGSFVPVRAEKDFFQIAESWLAHLYAAYRDGQFIGYCICEPGAFITEIKTENDGDFIDFLIAIKMYLDAGEVRIRLPEHQIAYNKALLMLAEGYHISCSMDYTVLNYKLVCEAFLKLKATYTPLPDGELPLCIHGFAGDEYFALCVQNGIPFVRDLHPEEKGIELSHVQALSMIFAPAAPERRELPVFAQIWLPLPIWMYRADEV